MLTRYGHSGVVNTSCHSGQLVQECNSTRSSAAITLADAETEQIWETPNNLKALTPIKVRNEAIESAAGHCLDWRVKQAIEFALPR